MTSKKQDNYAAVVVVLGVISLLTWPVLDLLMRSLFIGVMVVLGIAASAKNRK